MELLTRLLIIAYACVGVVSTIGYIPTIKDLIHHKKMSANVSSYYIWTITSVVTFLYSLFVLPDLLFQIVSALSLVSCGVILVLSIGFKHRK
jgi:hypothetical protein